MRFQNQTKLYPLHLTSSKEKWFVSFNIPTWLFAVLMFVIFYAVGIVVASNALSYYWYDDDLFTIRTYSIEELRAAFSGPAEPSGYSTLAYRPLSPLYYHVQHVLFGENVVLHRLFNIAFITVDIVIACLVAIKLGMTRWQVLLAGVMLLCMRNTWLTLVWPSIGVRAFNLFFVFTSTYLFLRFLNYKHTLQFMLSVIFFGFALFIREEGLPFLIITPAAGIWYLWINRSAQTLVKTFLRQPEIKSIGLYVLLLLVFTMLYWALRLYFVPDADDSSQLGIMGWATLFAYIPIIKIPFIPTIVAIGLMLLFWGFLAWMLWKIPLQEKRFAVLCLLAVIAATSIGTASARVDLAFTGLLFYSFFLSVLFLGFARRSRSAAVFTGIVVSVFILGSFLNSKIAQCSYAPTNVRVIASNLDDIWYWAGIFPIPQERIDYLLNYYRSFGINDKDYGDEIEALYAQFEHTGGECPGVEGELFLSKRHWLKGW
jgi:hypothetical protein